MKFLTFSGFVIAGPLVVLGLTFANACVGSNAKLKKTFAVEVRTARRPNGMEINAVMPRVVDALDDVELKAWFAFLKTWPAA
jgi:hypothetical protein